MKHHFFLFRNKKEVKKKKKFDHFDRNKKLFFFPTF